MDPALGRSLTVWERAPAYLLSFWNFSLSSTNFVYGYKKDKENVQIYVILISCEYKT